MKKVFPKILIAIIITVVTIVVVIFILGNYYDTFKCDIVNGSDNLPGWSNTKTEAIKRNTYICDVKAICKPSNTNTSESILTLNGWIESSWRRGFWYLTTTIDTGKDISYRVVLNNPREQDLILSNNKHNGYGQEKFYQDQLYAFINILPKMDTLSYNILNKDTLDFSQHNIKGNLVIHLIKNR